MICIIMALLKLLLRILQTEYKISAVGKWVTSRRYNMGDGTEAYYRTLGEA
jgi:hypothetical protein